MDSSKKLKTEPNMGKTFQIQFKLSFLVPHPHPILFLSFFSIFYLTENWLYFIGVWLKIKLFAWFVCENYSFVFSENQFWNN